MAKDEKRLSNDQGERKEGKRHSKGLKAQNSVLYINLTITDSGSKDLWHVEIFLKTRALNYSKNYLEMT